ncbi:MAG TPA: hypothetical protein VGH08_11070 [Chthoniobacterales bacterium]|jgi:hypothetical protein
MKTIVLIYFLACGALALAEDGPKIELKHRSSFNQDAESRNPFWPIGWKPTAKVSNSNAENAGPTVPTGAFAVTSITLDPGAHFAIINGKAIGEGQQFGLQVGSQVYQITVKRIEDGRVVLLRHDQEIVVPLRRK